MKAGLTPEFPAAEQRAAAEFRFDLVEGLRRRPRRLPCKYLYDARGSELFDRICRTPEYYPTRTEAQILDEAQHELAEFCGPHVRVVEPGSGSGIKTRRLLAALRDPRAYVPIDISRAPLLAGAAAIARAFPRLEVLPVGGDYFADLDLPGTTQPVERTVVFFPGSTIGNFDPVGAIGFLHRLGQWCRPGDRLLIGVDLQKPVAIVERAYHDAAGLTAAFNLNLLVRANRELGADFRIGQFAHEAVYDPAWDRIEMRLVSRAAQRVQVAGHVFEFAPGERIVTEHSHKYTRKGFERLAAAAGWRSVTLWTDERAWFGVFGFEWSGSSLG